MYKVLILDEDKGSRYMLRRFPWGHYGFEVLDEAASGHEALEKLRETSADLVVTDVRMSDMDGLDFLEALHAREAKTCLILLSSYNDFEYAQQGISLGVFDYMVKPISSEGFGQMLRRASIYLRKMHYDEAEQPMRRPVDLHMEELLEARSSELEALLLSGSRSFIDKAARMERSLAGLSAERRETFLVRLVERLYRAFDHKFPWVKNIETRTLQERGSSADAFIGQAQELFAMVDRYDLSKESSLLYAICRLVQENVEKEVSLHMVAARLCISPDYAGRIFKRRTGVNFIAFVTRTKMEHGKELLENDELKNYEISDLLGYSNPDYFRQLFKAHTGMTPTEYRNACRRRLFR